MDPRLAEVTDRLRAAGCVLAEEEAAELLAARPADHLLDGWLRRREAGEPLAWITGRTWFCGRPLHVAPGVYVPRVQTEDLARQAAAWLPPGGLAVDLCTGAGPVAAHLRHTVPTATVIGVDIDPVAAACAARNGVTVVVGDLDEPLHAGGRADVVTAVAPYVPTGSLRLLPADVLRHEPSLALDGGPDGLDLVRRVVVAAGRPLRPGGRLLLEVGGEQDEPLRHALTVAGFDDVRALHDVDGDLRAVSARRLDGPACDAAQPGGGTL